MSSSQQDFAIFNKFNFEMKPVAVKYSYWKPQGIEWLDKEIAFCEMLKEAQKGSPFYADKKNITCAGPTVLGMESTPPIVESGELGVALEGFKDTRAARRVYLSLPVIPRNTVNYVAFSTLDKLSFDPDILIITASVSQAEILLRAMSYATGKIWSSKKTLFVACAWLFVYPYITGELNYTVTGLSAGMKAKELFPEGLILMSIPNDLLSSMIQSLHDMKWILPAWAHGKEEFEKYFDKIQRELSKQP